MRLIFLGSPAFAVPSLQAVHAAGHEIVAIYTQPPRPAGRGQALQKTPVHLAAEELGIVEIRTPEKLKDAALEEILATPADVLVVVGYGLLLPRVLVENRLCINVHPSALPRWRGATPVQSAIWAGDTTTDVCLMKLEAGMDTGPVFVRMPVAIGPNMTSSELNDIVWKLGAEELVNLLPEVHNKVPVPQVGEATRAVKITPDMRRIAWQNPAHAVHNQVRALSRAPGCSALLDDALVKLFGSFLSAKPANFGAGGRGGMQPEAGAIVQLDDTGMGVVCGDGEVVMFGQIQRPGGKPMAPVEAARGWPALRVGAVWR